jgi:hypothetical protein
MINSISYNHPQASLTTHATSNQAQIQPIENKANKDSDSVVVNTHKASEQDGVSRNKYQSISILIRK